MHTIKQFKELLLKADEVYLKEIQVDLAFIYPYLDYKCRKFPICKHFTVAPAIMNKKEPFFYLQTDRSCFPVFVNKKDIKDCFPFIKLLLTLGN